MNWFISWLKQLGIQHIRDWLVIGVDKLSILINVLVLGNELGIFALRLVIVVLECDDIGAVKIHGILNLRKSVWQVRLRFCF